MLNKLLKYDLKNIYKSIIVFYAAAIIFSIIGRCLSLINTDSIIFNFAAGFVNGLATGMIICSFLNNFLKCWVRLKNNLYGDESYLTHTLPVKKNTLYLSKILAAVITIFTTVIVTIISLAIMFYSKENIDSLKVMLESTATVYNSSVFGLLCSVSLLFFLEMLLAVMVGYAAIIIGYRSLNNKKIKSIVIGFIMYMITQSLLLGSIFVLGLFNQDVMNLFTSSRVVDINAIKLIMYVGLVVYGLCTFIYYLIGKKVFNKGVNVD